MLFNSIDFAVFLPVVFILYWFVVNKSVKIQNLFMLAASYFFMLGVIGDFSFQFCLLQLLLIPLVWDSQRKKIRPGESSCFTQVFL